MSPNLLIFPLGFFAAATVLAQTNAVPPATPPNTAPETGPAQVLDQRIEITGSTDVRKTSTPSITVVSREELARFGDVSVADVLRRVPGITVTGAQGKPGEIRMRGLGSGYAQILVNGEAMPPGFAVESISPAQIERIEISRSATVDLSAQSIAGTINIILKQVPRQRHREVKASAASYAGNRQYSADGQLSDRDGLLSYSLGGGISREENSWPSTIAQQATDAAGNPTLARLTQKREHGTESKGSLTPKLTWEFGSKDKLSVDGFLRYARFDGGTTDQRVTTFGAPPTYSANDLTLAIESATARGRLNWSRTFDNESDINIRLGLNYHRRSSNAVFLGYDEQPVLVLDERVRSTAEDKGYVAAGKYRFPYSKGHAAAIGWDAERSERGENRIQRQTSPTGRPTLNLDEEYLATITRVAFYGQDEWEVDKSLSVYAGVRWEGLQTRTSGATMPTVSNRSGVVSPVLQGVLKLPGSRQGQVRMGLSRTYRAPKTRDLTPRRYVANDNTPTTPDIQGNPDLRPELAWGLDLAYEHYLAQGAGMLSVGLNARRIEDVILDRLSLVNGTWVSTKANNGTACVYGIEAEGKLQLKKTWPTAPDVELRMNAARNWSFVESVPGPNNRLNSQVPVGANLGLDWRVGAFPLTIGGNLGFQGVARTRSSDRQTTTTGAKRTFDLYTLWKYTRDTQLRFSLSNVLHPTYATSSIYADTGGSFGQIASEKTYTIVRVSVELKL
jgi:outer membrane receptor for ferrienterochelin and colicins